MLPGFAGNRAVLDSLDSFLGLARRDVSLCIDSVGVWGTASPDGRVSSNMALANRRMLAVARFLKDSLGVDGSAIALRGSVIPWDEFRAVAARGDIPRAREVFGIAMIGSDSSQADVARRMARLRALDNGRVWRVLAHDVFPALRRAVVLTVTVEEVEEVNEVNIVKEGVNEVNNVGDEVEEVIEAEEVINDAGTGCGREWHVSTNVPAWGMFIANATGEYDFSCRWSAALSLCYSAWNYGTSTRKFRTFILRPEVRYWPSGSGSRLFVEGHLAMASFNFAMPSWHYRIQDAGGKHPALGGGIGIGYRLPLGKNGRWAAEAQIGVGVYHLKYDRFENRRGGLLVDSRSRTWAGIDNFALSVVYNFNTARP